MPSGTDTEKKPAVPSKGGPGQQNIAAAWPAVVRLVCGFLGGGGRRPRSDTEGDVSMAADLLRRATVFSAAGEKFSLFSQGKSVAFSMHPVPNEGRIMIVVLRGTGRGGRDSVVARVMRADE